MSLTEEVKKIQLLAPKMNEDDPAWQHQKRIIEQLKKMGIEKPKPKTYQTDSDELSGENVPPVSQASLFFQNRQF